MVRPLIHVSSHKDSQSISLSGGTMLYYESMSDLDVIRGNKRFWETRELNDVKKIWEKAKEFGVRAFEGK